jgi:8-oxo-dGTP pyrophosphatase MutT (NUDIX family)
MSDMRKLINLVEGEHTPPRYDQGDKAHYDTLDKTGFFGSNAAGCVFYAKSTQRFLIVHRSDAVEQPRTWGNCGGAFKIAEETPVEAAQREGREETGYSGHMTMIPLLVFKKPGFQYDNFLAVIEDEFVPDLGWEATDYEWCDYGDWPSPLHFGLVALFSDTASVRKIHEIMNQE